MAPMTRTRSREAASEDTDGESSALSLHESFDLSDDPSFWKDNNIQVVIRIRPLSGPEISQQGHSKCVRQDSCQSVTWVGHPESRFTFDLVADENVSQEKLFKVAGVAMVDNCMAGYNSCMFAYGQTGSGKTHTMLGDIENGMRRHNANCGMTPRVFEYLFQQIQKEKEMRKEEKVQFTCKCSFLEIYNEQILDLLDPNSTNLQIREDLKKGVHVENLKEHEVSSAKEAMQQLIEGAANRKVAATNMNRASSRSHSIFTCVIESKWEVQGITRHRFARLNLVDLAGSERQKSSGAEGERLKEATNINKSLSTLGLVIMNLVGVSNKKSVHVPYRDSKLTFLLQDSLGGNSKTTIIANISPSNCCSLETLSTLKFAQRAKFIKNNAIVNEDASGDVISMRLQIQQLKKELAQYRGLGNNGSLKLEDEPSNNNESFDSPCILKLDGFRGNFSPLTVDKRLSQKKESEKALVAAIRHGQEQEASLRAMQTAKRTAEDLAAQREAEIKGLKMRLRFREEAIKRLQNVNSSKLSAESHLLSETQELKREIEMLKGQVERNPEITKFAMENLQLNEELRRLKAFVEEGERERMNEEINALKEKLSEALDWKWMHAEKDPFFGQGNSFSLEPSVNEELQVLAIQNEREIESLRNKLNLTVEENKNLQRQIEKLDSELQAEKSTRISKQESEESQKPDKKTEIKTLVEGISNASKREAEAIALKEENEDLRLQNGAIAEYCREKEVKLSEALQAYEELMVKYENAMEENKDLKLQLHEISKNCMDEEEKVKYENAIKENEDLRLQIGTMEEDSMDKEEKVKYENVMRENEDLRLQIRAIEENSTVEVRVKYENAIRENEELKLQIRAIEEDSRGGKEELEVKLSELQLENEMLSLIYENAMRDMRERLVHERKSLLREMEDRESIMQVKEEERESCTNSDELNEKLALVQDKLSCTLQAVNHLELIEKVCCEIDEVSKLVPAAKETVQPRLVQLAQFNTVLYEKKARKDELVSKFSVIVSELEISSSKANLLAEKEICVEKKMSEVRESSERKSEEIRCLEARKEEINNGYKRARETEAKLRGKIDNLKSSVSEAENLKKERERVLMEVNSSVKTVDLLKSEIERNKLVAEIKTLRDQLVKVKKEISSLTNSKDQIESTFNTLEEELQVNSVLLKELEMERSEIERELERVWLTGEDLRGEMERILPDYLSAVFEAELKGEEIRFCEESVREEKRGLDELEGKMNSVLERMSGVLLEKKCLTGTEIRVCVSEIVSKRIDEVRGILEGLRTGGTRDEEMMDCC
ncbi:hypothetical protein LUZ60_006617 [Juncus effusus]|nr:hypothetical protein LUZ60_006617 [Juncus effusus]